MWTCIHDRRPISTSKYKRMYWTGNIPALIVILHTICTHHTSDGAHAGICKEHEYLDINRGICLDLCGSDWAIQCRVHQKCSLRTRPSECIDICNEACDNMTYCSSVSLMCEPCSPICGLNGLASAECRSQCYDLYKQLRQASDQTSLPNGEWVTLHSETVTKRISGSTHGGLVVLAVLAMVIAPPLAVCTIIVMRRNKAKLGFPKQQRTAVESLPLSQMESSVGYHESSGINQEQPRMHSFTSNEGTDSIDPGHVEHVLVHSN